MSRIRVYIKTYDLGGSLQSDFTEVTGDAELSSVSRIRQKIDNSEFDVGTFKFGNLSLKLRNDHGKYSEPGSDNSIFPLKRVDSIVKITWDFADDETQVGLAIAGESVSHIEKILFQGLLNDSTSKTDIDDQRVTFTIQGLEALFSRVETNYSSLSAGDTLSVIIYELLNQTLITDILTVSQANISVSSDQLPDTIADLEETTVKEALDELLLTGNAVLWVDQESLEIIVKARTPTASVLHNFYGQASDAGIENISRIDGLSTGVNRMFNFWKWTDTTTTAKDLDSITDNGVRKKEIASELFTNTTKRTNILEDYRDEFGDIKQELTLDTPLDYETLELFLLDRVDIDYPTVYFSANDDSPPLYGSSVYGTAVYPIGQFSLEISTLQNWKIMGRTLNIRNQTISFKLREI